MVIAASMAQSQNCRYWPRKERVLVLALVHTGLALVLACRQILFPGSSLAALWNLDQDSLIVMVPFSMQALRPGCFGGDWAANPRRGHHCLGVGCFVRLPSFQRDLRHCS